MTTEDDDELRGVIDDEPEPRRRPVLQEHGHVTADLDWASSDADDPDGGSGRTGADDGGYLPGEGTGRPPDS